MTPGMEEEEEELLLLLSSISLAFRRLVRSRVMDKRSKAESGDRRLCTATEEVRGDTKVVASELLKRECARVCERECVISPA